MHRQQELCLLEVYPKVQQEEVAQVEYLAFQQQEEQQGLVLDLVAWKEEVAVLQEL